MSTISQVLAKIDFNGYSSSDETILRNTISNMYSYSATARSMLNEVVAKNNNFVIDRREIKIMMAL